MRKSSFKKGYGQIQVKDLQDVRNEIMEALGISSLQAFRNRMYGIVEPKVSDIIIIEKIFNKYGITEIWDELEEE